VFPPLRGRLGSPLDGPNGLYDATFWLEVQAKITDQNLRQPWSNHPSGYLLYEHLRFLFLDSFVEFGRRKTSTPANPAGLTAEGWRALVAVTPKHTSLLMTPQMQIINVANGTMRMARFIFHHKHTRLPQFNAAQFYARYFGPGSVEEYSVMPFFIYSDTVRRYEKDGTRYEKTNYWAFVCNVGDEHRIQCATFIEKNWKNLEEQARQFAISILMGKEPSMICAEVAKLAFRNSAKK